MVASLLGSPGLYCHVRGCRRTEGPSSNQIVSLIAHFKQLQCALTCRSYFAMSISRSREQVIQSKDDVLELSLIHI